MGMISENKKTSGVYYILTSLITGIMLVAQPSFSKMSQADYDKAVEDCRDQKKISEHARGEDVSKCIEGVIKRMEREENAEKSDKDACIKVRETIRKANSEMAKKCGEAGLGKECAKQAESCATASAEEPQDTMGALSTAAGFPQLAGAFQTLNNGQNKSDGICAKYNGKEYATQKDKITQGLDKTAEELADLTKEIAKTKKDFATEIQDIQKSIQDAQEELEKQKLKIKDTKRERLANFQNTQNQQKEQLRQKNMSILDIKGKIVSSDRDKAMKLVALTDASGKRTCMNEYNKARANYQKTNSSSTSNFMASSSAKKNDLVAIYTDCMAVFNQQRTALNESKKQEMDTLTAQLGNLQSEVDDLNGNIQLSANQLAEMEQDAATEGAQAEQKVIKLMQTAQQKMLTAQEEQNTNLQALAQKQQALTTKQTRLNNDLMKMGPVPDDANKATPKSISKEVGSMAEDLVDLKKEETETCAKFASKPTSSGSGSGKSKQK